MFCTRRKSQIYQYVAAITANLGIICSEMHYGWSSPYLPILVHGKYSFVITSLESSWLAVCPLIGGVFGALIAGFACDILGRRRLILMSAFPFFLSWILIPFAKSSVLLFVSRFIAGINDGLSFTAVPMYLSEIAEPRIRGLLASFLPVSIVAGLLLINILGTFLTMDISAYVASIIPVILLITFYWMPESPYFYLMKNNISMARESLQKFRGTKNVDNELKRLTVAVQEDNNKGKFLDLFNAKSNVKALLIACGLRSVQQLSGVTAIIFYCKTIFEEAKDFVSPNTATIIYFAVQLTLSMVASFIVDKSGRRPLLLVSTAGTALTLLLNGSYLYVKNCTAIDVSTISFLPIVAMLAFVVIFSMGLTTVPLLIMGEIFPTNIKAFALCALDIYYNVVATTVSQYFHWTNEMYGMHVPFFTFGCCCLLAVFVIYYYVPETKGKTLEDIQRELKGEAPEDDEDS